MPLSPEDVDAIGRLLEQRLDAHTAQISHQLAEQDRRARVRRRWWIGILIVLTIAPLIAGAIGLRKLITSLEDQLTAQSRELSNAKLAYQRQLAHDAQMQRERAEAVAHVGYTSTQNQADFDAGLIRQVLQLFNSSKTQRAKMAKAATSADPAALDDSLGDLSAIIDQASSLTMQMLLHETDPAHNTPFERLTTGEPGSAPATPAAAPTGHPTTLDQSRAEREEAAPVVPAPRTAPTPVGAPAAVVASPERHADP